MSVVTIDDVEAAAARLTGSIVRTPTAVSQTLSDALGCTVIVKFENLQFVASFKERGARNKLLSLTGDERRAGVVAVSAGNHAQAVARHAALLDIPATIVMPLPTPNVKVRNTRALGATVELAGETIADAMARGHELAAKGLTFVHPFDDPAVIAGGGTCALELLEDAPPLDAIVVPCGGGGLVSGMAVVCRARAPEVEVIGVQSAGYPSMARALAGDGTAVPGGSTLAEGIAVGHCGALTSALLRELSVEIVTVSEDNIEQGVNLFLEIEKVVAEGAGAAGLAALLEHRDRFAGRTIGVVLTGGNIDPSTLASIILRGLVRNGRLSRWRVQLDDRPGSLAKLTAAIATGGANIVEVQHQRLFSVGPVKTTEVELAVETTDARHAREVVAALEMAGYPVTVVPVS